MKIDVCIATIRPGTLGDAVESIQRQTHSNWRLMIIGQGPDPQLAVIGNRLTQDSRIRYLHLEKKGLSAARNKAIEVMNADVLAFTDDDCEADENWLSEMDRIFLDTEVGMVAGPLTAPPPERSGIGFVPKVQSLDGDGMAGANMALRASAIRKVGKFDENLGAGTKFPCAEDTDYLSRVVDANIRVTFCPTSIVHHKHGWRYGLKSVFRIKRAYALGYGAFLAKRKRAGIDLIQFEQKVSRETIKKAIVALNPKAFVFSVLRAYYVRQGYLECMKNYRYDAENGVLIAV